MTTADILDAINKAGDANDAYGPLLDTRSGAGGKGENAVVEKFETLVHDKSKEKAHGRALKHLRKALNALNKDDPKAGAQHALAAIDEAPDLAQGHLILAAALERLGQLRLAIEEYETALKLDPTDSDIYLNLGLAAWKLNMLDVAEQFFRITLQIEPEALEAANNLGGVLRDKGDLESSVEILRGAIYAYPDNALLWNSLGTVMVEQFDYDNAFTFYDEALRLYPEFGRAYHNMGYAVALVGPFEKAIAYLDKAVELSATRNDEIISRHDRSLTLLGLGRLTEGWDEYEIRLNPLHPKATLFAGFTAPLWNGEDLAGKRLLVVGEQGLGDEIMFANCFNDLIERLGPDGKLYIACEPRLASLFKRTFPEAHVEPHSTGTHNGKILRGVTWLKDLPAPDYYAPFATALRHTRRDIAAFPAEPRWFAPDPERVAYWRAQFEALGPGPYVGVSWRSMLMNTARSKFFSPLENWKRVFANKKVQFINIQYGDVSEDAKRIETEFGAKFWTPQGINMRDDLDENAALCAALDLTISPQNAAMNLAACSGGPVWAVCSTVSWPRLGTDGLPWYPNAKIYHPEKLGEWEPVFERIAAALDDFTPTGRRVAA